MLSYHKMRVTWMKCQRVLIHTSKYCKHCNYSSVCLFVCLFVCLLTRVFQHNDVTVFSPLAAVKMFTSSSRYSLQATD